MSCRNGFLGLGFRFRWLGISVDEGEEEVDEECFRRKLKKKKNFLFVCRS